MKRFIYSNYEQLLFVHVSQQDTIKMYEGWNFNSVNYLFTTDTK